MDQHPVEQIKKYLTGRCVCVTIRLLAKANLCGRAIPVQHTLHYFQTSELVIANIKEAGEMKRTFECLLAELCAPTLADVKPAGLFRYEPLPGEQIETRIQLWDTLLRIRGVSVRLLKECPVTGAVLVYVYRPVRLEALLQNEENCLFLKGEGYESPEDPELALEQLSQRLCCQEEFPHEIGVFLGYPLEDVEGFIRNQGKNYLCSGYWKVYGDPHRAKACFACYRRCEEHYRRMYQNGVSILRLTVAASS